MAPAEYETFWNFPRSIGTFCPARASRDAHREAYHTEVSRRREGYEVRLSHTTAEKHTVWTFLAGTDGAIERVEPFPKTVPH